MDINNHITTCPMLTWYQNMIQTLQHSIQIFFHKPNIQLKHYSNVPFGHYSHSTSSIHSAQVTSAKLYSICNPPLPSHLSLHPSAHFHPKIFFLDRYHHWNNTHPSLRLSALTPCGEKSSIYLVSPCFSITSPLCNTSIYPSIHGCTLLLPTFPLFSLKVLQAITNYLS